MTVTIVGRDDTAPIGPVAKDDALSLGSQRGAMLISGLGITSVARESALVD